MIFSYICYMIFGILIVIIAVAIAYLWVKFVFVFFKMIINLFRKEEIEQKENPYIQAQKVIEENNKYYYDYLDWMQKNGSTPPIEKIKTLQEIEADKKIKELL
jgi:hypothetical protein